MTTDADENRSLTHKPPTNGQQAILMGGTMGYAQKRVGRDSKPRYLSRPPRGAQIGWDLRQQEGCQLGMAEGRGEGR